MENLDDGYDNTTFYYGEDEEDIISESECDESEFVCLDCNTTISVREKGCSVFKKLCAKCKLAERDLLLGENGSCDDKNKDDKSDDHLNPDDSKVDGDPIVNLPNSSKTKEIGVEETVNDEAKSKDMDCNSAGFYASFWTNDPSVTLYVGGHELLFTHKKFHHGPHKSYYDLEFLSIAPLLFNYFLLAAVALVKDKTVFHSQCWVEHKKSKDRYLLLCVLRAKCLQVRYDFLLWDIDVNVIYLMCGVKKMSEYIFLPDVKVDREEATDVLVLYLKDPKNSLALRPGHPNKDEYGNLLPLDGFDPINHGMEGLSAKRGRKQRNLLGEELATASVSVRGKKGRPAKKVSARPEPKRARKITVSEGACVSSVSSFL